MLESPIIGSDGIRYCRVNGSPLTDQELFKDAWGERLAEEILHERDVRLPQRRAPAGDILTN